MLANIECNAHFDRVCVYYTVPEVEADHNTTINNIYVTDPPCGNDWVILKLFVELHIRDKIEAMSDVNLFHTFCVFVVMSP